jgi:hypothetical protein
VFLAFAGDFSRCSGEDLGSHPAAEEAAAPGEREGLTAVDRKTEALDARETVGV